MDRLTNLYEVSLHLLPIATFVVGLSSSLHCIGMCSGLVVASTENNIKKNFSYQFGRLLSYLILTITTVSFGHFLLNSKTFPIINHVTAILFAIFFIYWGVSLWPGKSIIHLRLPIFFQSKINKLWGHFLQKKNSFNAFILGSLSIFLPCGLLYGVVLASAAHNNHLIAIMAIFSFWLGTLPALMFSSKIIESVLKPLSRKMPKLSSIIILSFGIITIVHRAYAVYIEKTCH